jgi:hypothetical protein
MDEVTSKDGTTIAFDRSGEASPVNLVGGAQADRSAGEPPWPRSSRRISP